MTDVVENNEVSQDSKNLALLMWIGTIFFGFIPGLVLYLIKKDDDFVIAHSKEALNWSITAIFAYLAALVLTLVVIGILLLPAIGLCHLIFCIMAAVKASDGLNYKVPLTLRLIK